MGNPNVDDILKKYSRKIEQQMGSYRVGSNNLSPVTHRQSNTNENLSQDYLVFKYDMMPALSKYERRARAFGNLIKLKLAPKDEARIKRELDSAHIEVTPGEVVGLSLTCFIGLFFFAFLLSVALWLITDSFPYLLLFMILGIALFLFYYFYSMPARLAVKWRLKASSQMVPAILYIVVYMKHTSNLERAINFVSQHIEPPLALDFKKIVWDVETGKYSSIKDSLDSYLESWRDYSTEFIESFHLIESSLYEPDEQRRIQILERALRVILDGVHEKMLKYTHSIRTPISNIYMLGTVLPVLGLALLPLASTLLGGLIKWYHILVLYNLLIPFLVYYMTTEIMLKRPGGHGESSMLEKNPLYNQYNSRKPYFTAFWVCFPFLLLGLLPLYYPYIAELIGLSSDYSLKSLGLGVLGGDFFGYIDGKGPFGIGALILSLFIPFSIAMFFALSFSMKTKELIKTREQSKDLEAEFNSSLFTLGNRLGDGTPAEIAFAKVADSSKGQKTENFFRIVHTNIQSMGMGLEDAIFNPKRGAIVYYPSSLIATSMRILVESVKKSLVVAAQSLMSISDYVRNIHKINERTQDLLAEVVGDIKSNMNFLAPLLAGIVIGLASMITGILSKLKTMVVLGQGDTVLGGIGSAESIMKMFDVSQMIPPYFLQASIGIYIVEIIFILTTTLVVIDAGEDKLKTTNEIGKNLLKGGMLYIIVGLLSILALSILSGFAFPDVS